MGRQASDAPRAERPEAASTEGLNRMGDPASAPVPEGRKQRRERQRAAEAQVSRAADEAATEALAARLAHRFARPELLAEALTHRSAADPRRGLLDSNERLEFLGDRVLALIMAEWLAERFPGEREGELGKRLGVLVSAESLAVVGEQLGLTEALRLLPAEKRAGVGRRGSVIADGVEALLGALYLDGGLAPARALIRREWEGLLEASERPPVSPKSRLQEWLAARRLGVPVYRVMAADGPAHAPRFLVRAEAAGQEAEARGENKRAAEQEAAAGLLARLGVT